MSDYIEIRKETFPTFYRGAVDDYKLGWNTCLMRVFHHEVKNVRPVVHGRWKRVDPRSTVVTFRCSECNYYAHTSATNFCPNCGADMRGDETAIS